LALAEASTPVRVLAPQLNVQLGGDKKSPDDVARHFIGRNVWRARLINAREDIKTIPEHPDEFGSW
jgi:hypothetical protein